MTKATHTGTCQCCGNRQKLPNGVLSKHGYTVDYGWFNGVCYGAGELPFEQSKDLIEDFIVKAEERAVELNEKADAYEADTSPVCMHNKYIRKGYGGSYQWIEDEVLFETKEFPDGGKYNVYYWKSGERPHPNNYVTHARVNNLEEAIKESRGAYANHLRKIAKQAIAYAEWQKERIKDWKPTELKEIK